MPWKNESRSAIGETAQRKRFNNARRKCKVYTGGIRKNINKFDGFIALGCVIKGQTPHFDLLCHSLFNTILNLSIKYNKPIGNGVITALNLNQAKQRSKKNKSKKPNKGSEAANAVISILKNGPQKN